MSATPYIPATSPEFQSFLDQWCGRCAREGAHQDGGCGCKYLDRFELAWVWPDCWVQDDITGQAACLEFEAIQKKEGS